MTNSNSLNDAELRPRRSVLYMPAANARALEKAKSIPADALIFDLEDAVAPDAKADARAQAAACLLYTSPSPRDKRQSRMPSSA